MPWLELSLPCAETDQARYENALEDLGALSVTLVDADADTGNERAILEPGVGQTPLWSALVLTALFPVDTDALVLLAALEAFDPGLDWTHAVFRTVQDEDWERAWLDQFKPMRFGARTWIVPWNHELPAEARAADAAVVRLDPGLAFGSGTIRPPRCACGGLTGWPRRACCRGAPCSTSVAVRASSRWPRSSSVPRRPSAWTTTRRH